jgi:uncharacterized protein
MPGKLEIRAFADDGERPAQPGARGADEIVRALGLEPHPEGGYYVESYRAGTNVTAPTHAGARSASTAIYFLVTRDAPTTYLHRLLSDEVFHLYDGGPLEILRLYPDGKSDVARLGLDFERGERPQVVIPAGTWFGTELDPGAPYCLVGCTVAPGFDFADFELDPELELPSRFPEHAARLERMLR